MLQCYYMCITCLVYDSNVVSVVLGTQSSITCGESGICRVMAVLSVGLDYIVCQYCRPKTTLHTVNFG